MNKHLCEKCRVVAFEALMRRLYGKYWVCEKCRNKWNEVFTKLRLEHNNIYGWRGWKPVFVQWLKNNSKEKVIFT